MSTCSLTIWIHPPAGSTTTTEERTQFRRKEIDRNRESLGLLRSTDVAANNGKRGEERTGEQVEHHDGIFLLQIH